MALIAVVVVAIILFVWLLKRQEVKTEDPYAGSEDTQSLEEWSVDKSELDKGTLQEDKEIYPKVPDTAIYDVYLNIFPTKDKDGNIYDFSSFKKEKARDKSFNPILDCNIQIVNEDGSLDSLTNLDVVNASIHVRGNSSRGATYKSYAVKLKDGVEKFHGQKVLDINKHSGDITKIATKLDTDLLAGIDNIISYRTTFMRVWIRDAAKEEDDEREYRYYGLYTQTEQPNKTFLEVRGLSGDASLYKAKDFNFSKNEALKNVDDPDYNVEEFEKVLSIREGRDHKDLLEMIDAVNDPTRDFDEVFNTYFDEENYLTWLAFNILIGGNDIVEHNYLLYHPNNGEKWYFIPWDFDGTLQYGEYASDQQKLPVSLRGGQKLNQNILFRRYFRQPGNMKKVQAKMEELLKNNITKERVTNYINLYKRVLNKTMTLYPDITRIPMQPNELPGYLDGIYPYIEENYKTFLESIQYPTPMYVGLPEKNSNGTIHYAWQNSYSYQGYPITYNVQVATDFDMNHIVLEKKDIIETTWDSDTTLPPGTYYLKVTAKDSEGHEQLSMERYSTRLTATKGMDVNGVLEFTVE